MKLADTVTFSGAGLNRAAHLRADASRLRRLASQPDAHHLALWRGKVLMDKDGLSKAPRLGDDLIGTATEEPVFLGLADDRPVFAHNVSQWEPTTGTPDTLGAFHDPSRQPVPGLPGAPEFCELRSVMADLSPGDAELAAAAKAVLGWHEIHPHCARCGAKTNVCDGGWRRDCPSCNGQHFPRTDPVVIMLITRGNKLLLGRSPGWPEGMYSLLAGFVEPGETVEDAVRREVFEESAIPVGKVGYLTSQPWPFPASLMLGCWGEALADEITLDPNELEDALWVSREEMLDVFAGTHPTMRRPRKGAIAGFIIENWLKDRLD